MIIRANADTPEQALAAQALGASGVGLCRTEQMLQTSTAVRLMQAVAAASSERARDEALASLLPLHQASLEEIFRAVPSQTAYVRLLDPPLHSFLPPLREIDRRLLDARSDEDWDQVMHLAAMRTARGNSPKANPSMGHRGARLTFTHPGILRMQITAILQAALAVQAEGITVGPGILIPMVASASEAAAVGRTVRDIASDIFGRAGRSIEYRLGALIEVPRAALCAEEISSHLDFLCFGTNDLTEMTFGLSRDGASAYLAYYLELGLFKQDPFVTLDCEGVGRLLGDAMRDIRRTRPDFEVGACGDHAADPASLRFFHSIGVTFASCSPSCLEDANVTVRDLLEATTQS